MVETLRLLDFDRKLSGSFLGFSLSSVVSCCSKWVLSGVLYGRPRRYIPAEANEWMVDEKPAPNRRVVWMERVGGGRGRQDVQTPASGGIGIGRKRVKRKRRG